ncbi:putative bifunctional diguanylate cyclase/phosphodiesterase [Raoultibacter phocaeensis]|uniref:putative bifunctional diguanylate cyclase/phosphodiesterase n=1 Tax=Raoultibacter phocaeensis TaxID=2479841 RepID=UPI001117BEE5|nr:bifunctional diguanylate cyclase/phosphodiesterase [Raoultibacter phocaeensis]
MTWNLTAECIAFVIACIILAYSRKSYLTPSLKNRIFQVCLIITVAAIGLNIASTILIENRAIELIGLTWLITTLYFAATPLIGAAYYYYIYATFTEARPRHAARAALGSIPYLIYLACVASNAWTGSLFYLDETGAYHQGPLIPITYLVFYLYCAMCFVRAYISRRDIDPAITRILIFFPLLAVAVIAIQQVFPSYILSGSAAVCSLLIVYLYLQNKQISIDFLTGIPNRQEFSNMLALEQKHQNPFTAVLVSVDNFKFINDKFGTDSGDAFLGSLSAYLKTAARTPWLYRYGGDQFVALFEKDRRSEVDGFLAELRARMAEPWQIGDTNFVVSCSIGIVDYPDVAASSGSVTNALEYSVEESKRLGPNEPCRCTQGMVGAIRRKHRIADILRRALAEDGFTIHYQPIWSVPQQKFVAAEALCRLEDTELGPISPAEFIPIAEETGIIVDMTYAVLEKVCAFIKAARDDYPDSPFDSVSVNFSAVQFMQNDLPERTIDIIRASEIDPRHIKIEITESVLVSNPEGVAQFMLEMHEAGIAFCLDDFGTGYSNLSTILGLPIDVVKLDKSIVWMTSRRDFEGSDFLGHLVASFAAMGITVLAEGVETDEQRAFIEEAGCTLIQGFLYAKPMDGREALGVIGGSDSCEGSPT